jgi:hypothetical protein
MMMEVYRDVIVVPEGLSKPAEGEKADSEADQSQ